MFRSLMTTRPGHYLLLLGVMAVLTFPSLGSHSLWDLDEAVNAEASREMLERGTWIVPTFNFELRTAKPAMLNWAQMLSFRAFGVNEFAARLPSVIAAMFTILLTYELARRMFSPTTGLLSGLILATAFEFCLLAHAATPDSLLLLWVVLAFVVFWAKSADGSRKWWLPMAVACGFAVLTKGPVGVAMPGLILIVYFAWNRELSRLWDRKFFPATLAFLAIVLPWYILIGVETRGVFIKKFLLHDNLNRFVTPLENHRGSVFYHSIGLILLYAPWCVFLGTTLWHSVRQARVRPTTNSEVDLTPEQTSQGVRAYRLLIAWFGVYLVFFSVAATKLPNYVLPLYPALAILTARMIDRWRIGAIQAPRWVVGVTTAAMVLVGVTAFAGMKIAGGEWKLPIPRAPDMAGVASWAFIGVIPVLAALVAWGCHHRGARTGAVASWVAGAVAFLGLLASGGALAFDAHKAPRALMEESGAFQPDREVRIGSLVYFQPSTVWYARREVKKLESVPEAVAFLSLPVPVYVFVEEKIWEGIEKDLPVPCKRVARHWDLYKNGNIVVVWNEK